MSRRKFIRYFVDRGWLHLTLLALAAVFLFPFVWMLGMSMKTDDEATTSQLFPDIPTFRASSPYLREPPEVTPPANVTESQWDAIWPKLVDAARASVDRRPLTSAERGLDERAFRGTSANVLAARTMDRVDASLWAKPVGDVLAAVKPLMDDTAADSAKAEAIGSLKLLTLQARTLDGHLFQLNNAWTIESGRGEMTYDGSSALIKYAFDSAGDAPVVFRTEFDLPMPAENLQKLIVGLQNDDSWHRIEATLTVGPQTWTSGLAYFIAQHRTSTLFLQPPGRVESEYAPKTFIPLEPKSPEIADGTLPTHATLRLAIRPSGTFTAIYGKLQRNYVRAFRSVPFWLYVRNSTLLVVMQVGGALFSSAFVAYAFARLNWPGRGVAFGILLATMMLPSQVTMIPTFLVWKNLGLYNSLTPLWIGAWLGNAFFIFLMTQHMKTIPKELDEAARIDGLNAVQTWWYVIVPQLKPTLAAIAIMTFMNAWNEFMGPLVMLRDQSKFPLSLGLFGLKVDQTGDWTMLMAGNIIMVLPVILIFFFFQRYFIEGVTVSGMKG